MLDWMDLVVIIVFALVNVWPARAFVGRVVDGMPGASHNKDGTGAGARVGVLERLLVFLLIQVGQWGVIGFVVTAKSIARFRELEDKAFTDYYLAGTFTSLIVAVVTGLVAAWLRG